MVDGLFFCWLNAIFRDHEETNSIELGEHVLLLCFSRDNAAILPLANTWPKNEIQCHISNDD
jgi:hypothetical protein